MSQENVELVRRSAEAFARNDWDGVLAEFDPGVEWAPESRDVCVLPVIRPHRRVSGAGLLLPACEPGGPVDGVEARRGDCSPELAVKGLAGLDTSSEQEGRL